MSGMQAPAGDSPGGPSGQANAPAARRTAQKEAIRAELSTLDEFVSARDLHRRLEDAEVSVGVATVYRQLNRLAEQGEVDVISNPEGERLYRACASSDHHHHLVCRYCGKAVEIEPPAEQWLKDISERHGFSSISHTIEVFGVCGDCSAHQDRAAGS